MSEEERKVSPEQWKRRKFIAFGALGLFGAAAFGVRQWIADSPLVSGMRAPLRKVLDFNDGVNSALRDDGHLAKEFPKEMAVTHPKVNGLYGVEKPMDTDTWTLTVHGTGRGAEHVLHLTMADILALPKTEVCFDFKCIEGWSQVTHWGGVRFSDFAKKYRVGTRSGSAPNADDPRDCYRYMALRTPDDAYYVGIDMESALHPQTLLCYEMNGEPLSQKQGAPLRLIIPTKYGVKNLKRIGTMAFSDAPPPDYWHERGYDYDCGL